METFVNTSVIVDVDWLDVLSPFTVEEVPATQTKLDDTLAVKAKPTASPLQMVSDDADVIAGAALLVKTTSSNTTQGPSVTVQSNVAEVPAGTPVTADVGDDVVVIDAEPATTVQRPLPEVGVLPANVNDPLPHCAWSAPALAVTVGGVIVMVAEPSGPQQPAADCARK